MLKAERGYIKDHIFQKTLHNYPSLINFTIPKMSRGKILRKRERTGEACIFCCIGKIADRFPATNVGWKNAHVAARIECTLSHNVFLSHE